jgi:hypothetical protein
VRPSGKVLKRAIDVDAFLDPKSVASNGRERRLASGDVEVLSLTLPRVRCVRSDDCDVR